MRLHKLRIAFVGVVACGALLAAMPSAHAAAPAASASLCQQLTLEEENLSTLGAKGKFKASAFKATAKAFRNAGNGAPKKIDAAMDTIGSYYQKIGDAGSSVKALTAISAKDTTKYGKAIITWSTYLSQECT